jgi:D-2-hydroxyacid dehydrogenase (NADP+)
VLLSFGFRLNRDLVTKGKSLRWIHAMTTGVDKFLTFGLTKKEIILTNSRGAHAGQMTEHIFAFMLSFVRRFPVYYARQQECRWDNKVNMDTLSGKTLGILGLGSIGRELACKAKIFNMKVIGTKKSPVAIADVDEVLPAEEYRLLLPRVDFLVLLVPSTSETHCMIGREELSLMKDTAYLINVSRGDVIDQDALVEALKEKRIAGAGLDVTTPEPLPGESELWSLDNVIITSHVGGVVPDYLELTVDIFCRNLESYLRQDFPLPNQVDQERGY